MHFVCMAQPHVYNSCTYKLHEYVLYMSMDLNMCYLKSKVLLEIDLKYVWYSTYLGGDYELSEIFRSQSVE